MNLSSIASGLPGGPKLDMGSINDVKKNKRTLETDSVLWQQQQEMLTAHRQRFVAFVNRKLAGEACDAQIKSSFELLKNHIHWCGWDEIVPVSLALNKLGPEYHRCLVVLGGWHHAGKMPNLKPPAAELLKLMWKYRGLILVGNACEAMIKDANTSPAKLMELLHSWRAELPEDLGERPKELMAMIQEKKPEVALAIETALLYLEPRIFAFSPTRNNPTAGWEDYYRFAYAYRRLVGQFSSEFGKYYWGIYCK